MILAHFYLAQAISYRHFINIIIENLHFQEDGIDILLPSLPTKYNYNPGYFI